ncbi:MAG: porin family protein [Cocleimonas sp.]
MKHLTIKKALIVSALSVSTFATLPAFAGGGIGLGILGAGAAATPFFVGGSAGSSMLSPEVKSCCGDVKSADADANDVAYKLTGGYNINRRLALEGFYNDLGASDIKLGGNSLGTVKYKNYGLAAVYTKPVTSRINLRGKLGYGALESDFKGDVKHEKKNSGFLYKGVGAEYQITRALSAVLDYDHFDADMQSFSTGIRFGF